MMIRQRKNKGLCSSEGFTLIEVMVAVAIIGVALPALIMSMLGQIDSITYLRDKMEAQLVAENIMTELRIRNDLSGQIPKKEEGEKEMASRKWFWKTEFKEYPQEELKGLYAVEIKVWLKKDNHTNTAEEKPVIVFYGALLKRDDRKAIKRPPIEAPPF